MSTKDFRVTRPSFYKKGALFNQNLSRKGSNLAPIKEHSPKSNPLKYGGYSGKNNSFFVVVAGKDNKGKDIVKLIPVNTLIYNKMLHCDYKAKQELLTSYVANNFAINNFRIVKDDIKMYSLVKIDGAYYYLVGGTDERIEVKNAMQLLLSKDSIKAVKILEKESKDQFANIKNYKDIDIKLGRTFNEVISKYTNSVFGKSMLISDKYRKDIFKSVDKSILEFNSLNTIAKADNLLKFVTSMRPAGSVDALKMVGLIERIRKSNVISNFNEFKLINQSVTGLFENEEDLLKL
nr:Cas9 endonuclease PAM-interacting domain-containing protein [Lactobacillus iners]